MKLNTAASEIELIVSLFQFISDYFNAIFPKVNLKYYADKHGRYLGAIYPMVI